MSRQHRNSIVIIAALSVASCASRSTRPTTPDDPFLAVGVAPLPVEALAGGSALLLPVGALVLGDSAARVPDLASRRFGLLAEAGAVLDTALRQNAPAVRWLGLAEQRRALRMAPALGIEPDRLETAYLMGSGVEALTDPLWSQLRTLEGMTGARVAVAPAGVKIERRGGSFVATYVLVMADSRTGRLQWRGRTDGAPAATPEAALKSAAAAAVTGAAH
ncbi:MAG TPA: hypothetical protein VMT21_02740 [Gemmatimonadales bacterium]|nr:hypothetical protein [Gemmatimonadales bacterium]